MKKKSLWIWITIVLIVIIVVTTFHKLRGKQIDDNGEIIQNENLSLTETSIQIDQKIVEDITQQECYDKNWNNDILNLQFNENNNLINCYNLKWTEEWKWVDYWYNWQIQYERNYKDWKLEGKRVSYSQDWSIVEEKFYNNWEIVEEHNYKNWKLDWKDISRILSLIPLS